MPPLSGFSDNPFITRSDCIRAAYALLSPLKPYTSPHGARIHLPTATGTHFDEVAAQLEGFARPLWVVAPLLSSFKDPEEKVISDSILQSWVSGLKAGTDPATTGGPDGEYWGRFETTDQRMVELEIISYALLTAPDVFLPSTADKKSNSTVERDNERKRENIILYLRSINGKEMPVTNWRWFRIMTNLALIKVCGIPYAELKESIDSDHAVLADFYLGNGWTADGIWSDEGRQADYYSGSFAIQFSQLLYCKFASDIDPERCELFRKRARDFGTQFWRYFDTDGGLNTYRFAQGGFWAALIAAGIPLPENLPIGTIKGLLLQHLRYWASKPDIFNADGTLNIGYTYPNMYMCEDYNSPQSVYWCLKTLIVISLPDDHEFWTCEELPHPMLGLNSGRRIQKTLDVEALDQPKQILISSRNHHYLLSLGQFCPWPIKATSAKYCKFAYSSSFGFSVPTGPLLQQLAPDNMLMISEDEGDTWRTLWKSANPKISENIKLRTAYSEDKVVQGLSATWSPGIKSPITVKSTLIPPTERWPDWHVRIHKISRKDNHRNSIGTEEASIEMLTVEGGFSIFGQKKGDGQPLPRYSYPYTEVDMGVAEGRIEEKTGALILSSEGASGIVKPDANTNLIYQRSLIPTVQQRVVMEAKDSEVILAVAVFARHNKSHSTKLSGKEIIELWNDKPIISFAGQETRPDAIFIEI